MIQAKRASLRAQLMVGYTDILEQAKKSQKGLRNQYLFTIMLVGDHPEGLRCVDAAKLSGRTLHNMYQRLFKAQKAGYIQKANKLYSLTDSGRNVYSAICAQFDILMKDLIKHLVSEAAKRGKLD